ncbi:MAG TPA: NTP transferase domain-containing protein [Candidatus Limnocylindria bacterium]|nr:NTP transferase domain-containing protein [Candidatus Limnocylindria bacterium]
MLLAAGRGKRIGDISNGAPKVMLPLPSGRSLLAENLCNAFATGAISRATVITGYMAEVVDREVAAHEQRSMVATVHNPDFAVAGPVRSLWEARDLILDTDVLIANGDTFYRPEALATICARGDDGLYLAYSAARIDEDDVKITRRPDGLLTSVGKAILPVDADGISAGLFLARGSAARQELAAVLHRFIDGGRAAERGVIWHDLVGELATMGGGVHTIEIDPGSWQEVDTPADYDRLRTALH